MKVLIFDNDGRLREILDNLYANRDSWNDFPVTDYHLSYDDEKSLEAAINRVGEIDNDRRGN